MILRTLFVGTLVVFSSLPGWAAEPDSAVATSAVVDADSLTNLTKPIIVTATSPTFTIRLATNPGTGYQWYLVDYNPRLIKLLSQQSISAKTKLVGAPGISVWEFQSQRSAFMAPQVTRITLEYRRGWEEKAGKRQVFHIVSQPPAKEN